MFLAGYAQPKPGEDWDWRSQQAAMKAIGKRPDLAAVRQARQARKDFQTRAKMMDAAKARGAGKQELRSIMEA